MWRGDDARTVVGRGAFISDGKERVVNTGNFNFSDQKPVGGRECEQWRTTYGQIDNVGADRGSDEGTDVGSVALWSCLRTVTG